MHSPAHSSHKRYWISDLHLFSRRSLGDRHWDAILSAARQAKTFVLGGDIFDFSWSTRASDKVSVDEAVTWLDKLISHAPGCRFHFLLGNHDCHRSFIDRLARLEETATNLTWHPFYLRMGNTLFLHGDAADFGTDAQTLVQRRTRWLDAKSKGPLWHLLYDLVVFTRLHRSFSLLVYGNKRVARQILRYLDEIGHGRLTGIEHVYFGHTHVPMSHYEYDGVKFHNGGAPLKGLSFQILEPIVSDS